jgi:hypothetical protein
MSIERFWVEGVLLEEETERPLRGLIVRAYDKDLVFDDVLGFSTSADDGTFKIVFTSEQFADLFEKRPDVYLRIFAADGVREIFDTRAEVRKNASRHERFELRIPAARLTP